MGVSMPSRWALCQSVVDGMPKATAARVRLMLPLRSASSAASIVSGVYIFLVGVSLVITTTPSPVRLFQMRSLQIVKYTSRRYFTDGSIRRILAIVAGMVAVRVLVVCMTRCSDATAMHGNVGRYQTEDLRRDSQSTVVVVSLLFFPPLLLLRKKVLFFIF